MNVRDYLIDHTGVDFQKLFANWGWCISGTFTVWLINRFGDLFIQKDDGSIWWLRLDVGSYERAADSKERFLSIVDDSEMANEWLMIPLVDRLVEAKKTLKERECYAFTRLPILGGDYAVENVEVRDLKFQYDALGPIYEQMKDLPDGTRVEFKFKE